MTFVYHTGYLFSIKQEMLSQDFVRIGIILNT